jgi:hypothetical protein
VSYHPDHCGYLVRKMGLSLQKPVRKLGVSIRASFSSIGKPNRWSVQLDTRAEIGSKSPIGMESPVCGYASLSQCAALVLCTKSVQPLAQRSFVCAQMKRPTPLWWRRANVRKRQHFGNSMRREQASKERLRKPCAPVRCGTRATLASRSSDCKPFSQRSPSMCCGLALGSPTALMPQRLSRVSLGWSLQHNRQRRLSSAEFANNIVVGLYLFREESPF